MLISRFTVMYICNLNCNPSDHLNTHYERIGEDAAITLRFVVLEAPLRGKRVKLYVILATLRAEDSSSRFGSGLRGVFNPVLNTEIGKNHAIG